VRSRHWGCGEGSSGARWFEGGSVLLVRWRSGAPSERVEDGLGDGRGGDDGDDSERVAAAGAALDVGVKDAAQELRPGELAGA